MLDGLSDAARRAEKQDAAASSPHIELAQSGRSFQRAADQSVESESDYLFWFRFSLFVGDNVGAAARWGIFALITTETLARFTVVASLFALPKMRRGYQRLAKWIDGFAGALFAGFGIHLIISR